MSVGTEVQKAVYSALSTPLASLGAGLYDEVPELPVGMPDTSFPYVEIGEVDVAPWDWDDNTGHEVYVQLHVWSRYRGKKEAHDIFQACRDTLHRQSLSVTGYRVVDILQSDAFTVRREADNATIHGFGRFKITVTTA